MTGRGRARIWNVPFSGPRVRIGRTLLRTARSDRSAPNRHLEICSRVLFGFFVSYLDFLCPVWIFCVLFGYFRSFFGFFVSYLDICGRFWRFSVVLWRFCIIFLEEEKYQPLILIIFIVMLFSVLSEFR